MENEELKKFLEWFKTQKQYLDEPDETKPILLAKAIKEAEKTTIKA